MEQAARLDCLVYICRVFTDGNPADGPSRPGKCTPAPELHWKKISTTLVHALDNVHRRAWERQHIENSIGAAIAAWGG